MTEREADCTQRGEEDDGSDKEAQHQADHDHAGHDGAKAPPAHHQDDAAHHPHHSGHGQPDWEWRKIKINKSQLVDAV